MVGGGIDVDRLKARVSAEAVHNVRFLPRFRTEEMGRILPLADALLVHLRDDPLFKITVPSKTQAYMMAAQPVVMAVRGDAANLIERAGAGLTCQPEDPNAIAATVIRMFAMHEEERRAMGQRGKAYYDRELSLAVGVARYDRLLRNVMEQIS
jgi:colanic acid biosynthesis glycosyl transferase WcaI